MEYIPAGRIFQIIRHEYLGNGTERGTIYVFGNTEPGRTSPVQPTTAGTLTYSGIQWATHHYHYIQDLRQRSEQRSARLTRISEIQQ
jgi:hypothetical protein